MIPWTVSSMEPGQTFLGQLCEGSLECFREYATKLQQCRLTRAFVGSARDSLVAVDYRLSVDDVCRKLGSYIRLNCEK